VESEDEALFNLPAFKIAIEAQKPRAIVVNPTKDDLRLILIEKSEILYC
jgi:hypothetical protein